jgi:hypothetical protein
MRRTLALTVVAAMTTSSMALASETLSQSAARIAHQVALETAAAPVAVAVGTKVAKKGERPRAEAAQAQAPGLQQSGMSKRNKILIYLGIGVGFAAAAYAIDHNVVDVTPSSLGKRKD